MTRNRTGPFHTSKPPAPISHPMKPAVIPRAIHCALVGQLRLFWLNWVLQGCAGMSEKEITFIRRKKQQAGVGDEEQLSTTWVC